jgi:anti-sigma regulatory factor (Ser/Thr protein kinase)
LSNIARHAGATRVAIALTITPRELTMAVRDDRSRPGAAATRELGNPGNHQPADSLNLASAGLPPAFP